MENKVLFINACVRPCSRTLELSRYLLNKIGAEVTELDLYLENLLPLNGKALEKRNSHDYSGDELKFAKQFACADTIVIAAPFWDLSFPSVLKVYFENITVSGITFEYSNEGRPVSKCRAKSLYYVTTSGGPIGNNNFGFDYVKALAKNFFGIEKVGFFSAEGLDIFGADVEKIMEEAKEQITKFEF